MKIVLAEKVSPATLAVFESEAGWQIVTHDQIKNGLAAELADADGLVPLSRWMTHCWRRLQSCA
jgi:D-3-phosphoglycerate dehydrogenase